MYIHLRSTPAASRLRQDLPWPALQDGSEPQKMEVGRFHRAKERVNLLAQPEARRCHKNDSEKVEEVYFCCSADLAKDVSQGNGSFPGGESDDVHWNVDTRIAATVAITAARSAATALELPA